MQLQDKYLYRKQNLVLVEKNIAPNTDEINKDFILYKTLDNNIYAEHC